MNIPENRKPVSSRSDVLAASGLSRRNLDQKPISPIIISDMVSLGDLLMITIAGFLADYLYLNLYLGVDMSSVALLAPLLVCSAAFYQISRNRFGENETLTALYSHFWRPIFSNLIYAFFITTFVGYMFKIGSIYSRGWLLIWFMIALGAITLWRLIVSSFILNRVNDRIFKRVAILGANEIGTRLAQTFNAEQSGIKLAGIYDDGVFQSNEGHQYHRDGNLNDLIELGLQNKLDDIVVAVPANERLRLQAFVQRTKLLPVNVHLCPDMLAFELPVKSIGDVSGLGLLSVHHKPIAGWGPVLKGLEDYTLASIAFLICLPAMVLIAIAIKVENIRQPVFFRQNRHGFNHLEFHVIKFRTMRTKDNGEVVHQATKNDPRVTKVGRFLRRTSLDELPQLINVLKGEMSLVGPRPHAVAHNNQYSKMFVEYANRHRVKPGITGWAQVNGLRGQTDDPDPDITNQVVPPLFQIGLRGRYFQSFKFGARAYNKYLIRVHATPLNSNFAIGVIGGDRNVSCFKSPAFCGQ